MTPQFRRRARGFTLLELIISVALVLVLMLAVTKIFSITSATIGATQGIAAATRDARAAQAVFARDMAALASDSPFVFIKYDGYIPAFRNAADLQDDHDFDPSDLQTDGNSNTAQNAKKLTVDLDDSGVDNDVTGESLGTLALSNRNHRQDVFSFCARDRYIRQTGNTSATTGMDQIVSSMSSSEAWITYGHLALPKPDGTFFMNNPGNNSAKTEPGSGIAQNNPSNYYASQWVLGRTATLMVLPNGAPTAALASQYINDNNGVAQQYYTRQSATPWTTASNDMSPLGENTKANYPASNQPTLVSARYDLVGIDMENAKTLIRQYNGGTWWTAMLATRPEVNPYVIKPITAATASRQVPIFLPACSQFVVEYAGDFVSQLPDGTLDVTAPNGGLSPDGKIDFLFIQQAGAQPGVGQRKIQWFGYPRSTTGGDTVNPTTGDDVLLVGDFVGYITDTSPGGGAKTTNPTVTHYTKYDQLNDVTVNPKANPDFAAWERFGTSSNTATAASNRANITFIRNRGPLGPMYAAWGPDSIDNANQPRPKMYRITVAIDRPEMAGRSADPQTFEYVFNVP